MAGNLIVTCPECEKKFKPKADVSGKKIKCPFCSHPFVVPAAKEAKADKAKPDKADKAKASDAKPAAAAPEVQAAPEEDNIDPYGIKTVELVPRCPNCTQEMGEHEIICLACGYNTMTRQWGKTQKVIGVTANRQILYLLPPLASAAFVFVSIIFLLICYFYLPNWVAGEEYWENLDSEALRMWLTLILLFLFWWAGVFCFQRFITKPMPDEIEME
jgi:hypothetical protein